MKRTQLEIAVGAAVIAAVIILVLGLVWGRKSAVFSPRITYSVLLPRTGGLEPGDPVTVRGVKSGRIENIELLAGRGVQARFSVQRGVHVSEDARCIVRGRDLMGGVGLSVENGISPRSASPGSNLPGIIGPSPFDVLAEVHTIAGRTDSLLTFMQAEMRKADAAAAVQEFRGSVERLSSLISVAGEDIQRSAGNIRAMTDVLAADSAAQRAIFVLSHASNVLRQAEAAVDSAAAGSGTMGTLISSRELHRRLVRTSAGIDSLVNDVRRNPARYLHFSLF